MPVFLGIFELLNFYRKKMTFSVNILGNASAMPTKQHFPTAQILNVHGRLFLIDCGEGAQMQLQQCGLSFLKIDAVFISHLHGDHLFGLFGLLSTMSMLGRRSALPIYAPEGLQQILDDHLKYFGTEMQYTPVVHAIDTVKPALIYENKAMTVHSIPLQHRVPAAGFLFRERTPQLNVHKDMIKKYGLSFPEIVQLKRGEDVLRDNGSIISVAETTYLPRQVRSYAFCSDTALSEEVIAAVRGVDLLYHEATFQNDRRDLAAETLHSTAADAAYVAKAANVKKLLIGHFSSRYTDDSGFLQEAQAIFPNTEIAKELSVFEVGG
jgi:ribonuclease Z